jgi:hypothetical protein
VWCTRTSFTLAARYISSSTPFEYLEASTICPSDKNSTVGVRVDGHPTGSPEYTYLGRYLILR